MPTPIVLLASGTHGDVLPYLALGLGLQRAGVAVRVATHASFRPLVEAHSLPFALLEGNLSELMTRAGGQSALTYDGNPLRSLRGTLRFYQAAQPLYRRLLESAWEACRGAAALVYGLPTTWAAHVAEALGIPCIGGFLQPFSRTRQYPSPLLPFTFSLGPTYNLLTYRLVEQLVWQPWRAAINRWRRETLRLPPAPLAGLASRLYTPGAAVLYAYSPRLAPPPPDWPSNHYVTGYWFLGEPTGEFGQHQDSTRPAWSPPAGLERFLQAGPPPIYVGFGSPGSRRPAEVVPVVLQALAEAGLRAVFALPAETPESIPLPPSVFRLPAVSHAWLFARLSAAVHHGGAGTTAASLRAGLPTLILPLAIDQFFWGERVAALGLGPPPIPQRNLDRPRLAQALRQLAGDEGMRARAARFGQELAGERGVERAVQLVEQVVE